MRDACCCFLVGLTLASAQSASTWRDPSPHRTQMVAVQDGVKLEVLDWGGQGRPLVLLAGYLTAHAFDDLAPKLAKFAHVYGVTRRGLGASTRTATGYTAKESADDIVKVLDQLHLASPVIAGHSFGGQDVAFIAANYPDRIAGAIFLNSGEDPKLQLTDYGPMKPLDRNRLPAPMRGTPPRNDMSSYAAYLVSQKRTQGVAFPEAELRMLFAEKPDGSLGEYLVAKSVRDAMFAGLAPPEYKRIRVPVLALFATPASVEDQAAKFKPSTADERAAIKEKYVIDSAMPRKHISDMKQGVANVKIVELPGANFYIFLSNGADLLREIPAFLAGLR